MTKLSKILTIIASFFIGLTLIYFLFLNVREDLYMSALLEYIGGGFSGELSEFYLKYTSLPIGLMIKFITGGVIGAILFPKIINFSREQLLLKGKEHNLMLMKKCPNCAEYVFQDAKICRFCKYLFSEL